MSDKTEPLKEGAHKRNTKKEIPERKSADKPPAVRSNLLDHLKERREEAIFIHGKCKEDKQISFVKGRLTELNHFISLLNSEEE